MQIITAMLRIITKAPITAPKMIMSFVISLLAPITWWYTGSATSSARWPGGGNSKERGGKTTKRLTRSSEMWRSWRSERQAFRRRGVKMFLGLVRRFGVVPLASPPSDNADDGRNVEGKQGCRYQYNDHYPKSRKTRRRPCLPPDIWRRDRGRRGFAC